MKTVAAFILYLFILSSLLIADENNCIDLKTGVFGVPFHSSTELILKNLGTPSGIIKWKENDGELWIYSDKLYLYILNSELVGVTVGLGIEPISGDLSIDMYKVDRYQNISSINILNNKIKFNTSYAFVQRVLLENMNIDIGSEPKHGKIAFNCEGFTITLYFLGKQSNYKISYELSLVKIVADINTNDAGNDLRLDSRDVSKPSSKAAEGDKGPPSPPQPRPEDIKRLEQKLQHTPKTPPPD